MSLLPTATFSAPGVPLYGSGGGGGTVGPNPVVSSITVATGNITATTSNGFSFNNTTTSVIEDAFLQSATVPLIGGAGTANIFLLNSASGSNNSVTLGAGNDNASYIWTGSGGNTDASQPLYLQATSVSASNLLVSSINGAAPGGGGTVGPNLVVSSIAIGQAGLVDSGSLRYGPTTFGTIALPYGFSVQSSDGFSVYTTSCANSTGELNDFKCVSTATATVGLRTQVTTTTALVNYPSFPGGNDGGSTTYAVSTLSHSAPSTISVASPAINFSTSALTLNGAPISGGTVPGNLTVSSLTLAGAGAALGATLNLEAFDTNLYDINVVDSNAALVTGVSIGTVGGRNQVYITSNAEIENDLRVSSISECALANMSSLNVSSINGAAPGGLTNFIVPFVGGSVSGENYQMSVGSNTIGIPVQLTSTLITSSSHKYLVSYSLTSGSNSDTSSYTKIQLYAAGSGSTPTMQSAPGDAGFWFLNGNVGARSCIISGAAALRLEGGNSSATTDTLLLFDNTVQFAVTDLGV